MRAAQNMIMRKIAGETVLIPTCEMALKVHGMIIVSESGAFLWEKLQKECSRDELVQSILEEYEVDRKTAEQDVDSFIEQMQQVGILA